jgi:hypothetical protein
MAVRWLALAAFVLSIGHVLADGLTPELRTAIDGFSAHRRVAMGYLRTDNPELAALEIERLRDRWQRDVRRIPPGVLNDRALAAALAATEQAIFRSLAAADEGDLIAAQRLLDHASRPLQAWRKANGVRLFSDCIEEASAAYERLDAHRAMPPDLANPEVRGGIVKDAAGTEAAINRCNDEAPPGIRDEAEFRRLVDGMLGSLRQVPDAVRQQDSGLLHRLLIEQRAFDRLLAFRFG